ncbi:ATP-NAD kinase family protein [Histomonas meleagridis]|uniref:ATP-NAD kinase family protein n=1 Tax=Histomonas meleagridis TaxID=135588 RepID=UPI003559B824|nr:ATP-NAD kinase family protein [Histomonas meleagridis]KAH0803571.1 ATP-NAD kinase family protein [Histomonas meleagridis]
MFDDDFGYEEKSCLAPAPFKVFPIKVNGTDWSMHLEWVHQPRTALIIEKIHDPESRHYLIKSAEFLFHQRKFAVFVERYAYKELQNFSYLHPFDNETNSQHVDFVLAFGGDGTLLHISTLFPNDCPPIMPFAMGSLGFLTPFLADDYQQCIDDLILGFFAVTTRTRAIGTIVRSNGTIEEHQILNDITLKSSFTDSICAIDCFIDGKFFTTIYGDGLIVATSTGSTAYNLSAGGPMLHPSVSSLLWTPICAHSLNAHPLVLPDSVELTLAVSPQARINEYNAVFDSFKTKIEKGDKIIIKTSPHPLPTVCQQIAMIDWLNSISKVLRWNQPMRNLMVDDV